MSLYKYGDYYIGRDGKTYYYNGTKWEEWLLGGLPFGGQVSIPPSGARAIAVQAYVPAAGATKQQTAAATALTIGPTSEPGKRPAFRYPDDVKEFFSDYIFFEFGKYNPPFAEEAGTGLNQYNNSAATFKVQGISVILPMPQDLGSEMRHDWEGKSFTRVGASAIAALGAGNIGKVGNTLKDFGGNIEALKTALITVGLNNVPGVGGNISMNDISGSTKGIILNPNAEVLYSNPNLREIGFTFKMVPHTDKEAKTIYSIVHRFRSAASPKYGLPNGGDTVKFGDKDFSGSDNFIQVPELCKFTFMKGQNPHPWITQYKPCAITRVQVNYTPDGTYATYEDGAPIAVELQVGFMETKLLYSEDIKNKFGGGTF